MKLSIIIVSYNTCKLLGECLNSIFANSPPCDFEVLVVDNASSDGSSQIVQNYYPQVHLIQNRENIGFAKANNQAIIFK